MRTASGGGSVFWFEKPPDHRVARRIDVDRKRRLRLLAHELEGILDDRRKRLCIRDDHRSEDRTSLELDRS